MEFTHVTGHVNVVPSMPAPVPLDDEASELPIPEGCPPACPDCGGCATFWFLDANVPEPELVCVNCVDTSDGF